MWKMKYVKKGELKPEDFNDQWISSTVDDLKNGKYDHRGKLLPSEEQLTSV